MQLVAASRERVASRLSPRERLTHGSTAFLFVIAAATLAAHDLSTSRAQWLLAPLFISTVALASRVELEVGSGFASPVELVVIPMLFALPVGQVPAAVAFGLVLGQLPSYLQGRVPTQRIIVAVGNASYTLAPALVFMVFYDRGAGPGEWAVLTVVAVCAQFVADGAISTAREYFAVRVEPWSLVQPLGWILFVDACLVPVGFAASLAGLLWAPGFFLPLPLLLLTRLFANERSDRVSHALELSAAYRGTALLLGDVVEADDAYTGAHSRNVVNLAVAVADHIALDARSRHLAELTALLHDVGKIRIPKTILNKKGPLTAEERTIIETHTIHGEQLLSRVGGLLTEVGHIVRFCHERYDGHGYPDGLAGHQIPIIARIVFCCDAFSAMTTTRAYRAAMSADEAREELVQNRGTQFDPDVVDAFLAVTITWTPGIDSQGASWGRDWNARDRLKFPHDPAEASMQIAAAEAELEGDGAQATESGQSPAPSPKLAGVRRASLVSEGSAGLE
jgi:HD-GYP domain-containing protein (c-di-GMP phosphodiesterase class II)